MKSMMRSHYPLLAAFVACAFLCSPSVATAFCGYFVGSTKDLYNDATQVVLMRDGTTTVTTMRPRYRGPVADFAMVIPVAQVLEKEDVRTLSAASFDTLDALTSPRLVEYEEHDPCAPIVAPRDARDALFAKIDRKAAVPKPTVRVAASFERGEYDIVILDANDSTALESWLNKNGYKQPKGAAKALAPYISGGFYFFAAKVNAKRVQFDAGAAVLSPIQFRYTSKDFQLPIRLGLLNAKGKQDLVIFVLAKERVEVANRPNAFIPTNLDLPKKDEKRFGDWYDDLFAKQLRKDPTTVVTEYAWPVAMKCDPCPSGVTALGSQELEELGGGIADIDADQFTITRLHARYDATGGTSDLVFRSAKPVVGGREVRDKKGNLEQGAKPAGRNAFQARYALRRPWTGPIACKEPNRGRWAYNVRGAPRFGPVAASNRARDLTAGDVKASISRYNSRLKFCTKSQNAAGLTGTAKIRFEIQPSGRTTNIKLVGPARMLKTDVGECLEKVFSSMTFPKTSASKNVPVTYPIVVK